MSDGTKRCPSCSHDRPLSDWGRNRSNADGLQSHCNPCRAERRERNSERIREANRQYAASHREEARQRAGQWRIDNRDRARERDRLYYLANKDRWRGRQRDIERKRETDAAYREANRDRIREYMRDYCAEHPEVRAEHSGRRRARLWDAPGDATAAQIAARIEYYGGRCWMCGAPWEHIDHVKPLSKGGSNWPANLRPACAPCNLRKKNRWPLGEVA